ncbi:hypothetical protein BDY17DRAFT_171797 [Neohortaea acidophila]|uniref:Uncharacterized protein n=1 Tax=Neohortaea acidophila TaxID=245834 RepID=A0A6A6PP06_9PEZI|nr:uncharacterized protein BDY17DRAFT_171797 [Neohortaea acidophila]KAF2481809.1 hypothetical protein BDY17DRAFT_171797 [Neohortaea acidophila]
MMSDHSQGLGMSVWVTPCRFADSLGCTAQSTARNSHGLFGPFNGVSVCLLHSFQCRAEHRARLAVTMWLVVYRNCTIQQNTKSLPSRAVRAVLVRWLRSSYLHLTVSLVSIGFQECIDASPNSASSSSSPPYRSASSARQCQRNQRTIVRRSPTLCATVQSKPQKLQIPDRCSRGRATCMRCMHMRSDRHVGTDEPCNPIVLLSHSALLLFSCHSRRDCCRDQQFYSCNN